MLSQPSGLNPARALRMALADADIEAADVGYVNARGTLHPRRGQGGNACPEAGARRRGRSTRGRLLDEGSNRTEAAFTILALRRGVLPPTINQFEPDPDCNLDYIPNTPRPQQVEFAVSNSFGFGGHNTAVVFRRWPSHPS
jgi:3-oxoacyl-[acyl-carrier-protein] synthase II